MDHYNDPLTLFDNRGLGLSGYNSFLTYPSLNPYSAARSAKTNANSGNSGSKRHDDYVEKSRKQQVGQLLYSGNVQSEVCVIIIVFLLSPFSFLLSLFLFVE